MGLRDTVVPLVASVLLMESETDFETLNCNSIRTHLKHDRFLADYMAQCPGRHIHVEITFHTVFHVIVEIRGKGLASDVRLKVKIHDLFILYLVVFGRFLVCL